VNIVHLLPILLPKQTASEALSQDIAALQAAYGGQVVSINPNARLPLPLPRLLFGFPMLRQLRQVERTADLFHFWSPDLFAYPVLRWLRRPRILSLTGSVGARRANLGYLNAFARVLVQDEDAAAHLRARGVANVAVVRPGVDGRRFTCTAPPATDDGFHLLMASAPWTPAQFRQKGVDALLTAAQRDPGLRLTFLWRGVLADAMAQRVAAAGVADRVRVFDALVDVNQVLAGVHAAVVLAEHGAIVKAYPHSLLDALAAGPAGAGQPRHPHGRLCGAHRLRGGRRRSDAGGGGRGVGCAEAPVCRAPCRGACRRPARLFPAGHGGGAGRHLPGGYSNMLNVGTRCIV
jgi:hypothetical protein